MRFGSSITYLPTYMSYHIILYYILLLLYGTIIIINNFVNWYICSMRRKIYQLKMYIPTCGKHTPAKGLRAYTFFINTDGIQFQCAF